MLFRMPLLAPWFRTAEQLSDLESIPCYFPCRAGDPLRLLAVGPGRSPAFHSGSAPVVG